MGNNRIPKRMRSLLRVSLPGPLFSPLFGLLPSPSP
jgi:hypothetical protein